MWNCFQSPTFAVNIEGEIVVKIEVEVEEIKKLLPIDDRKPHLKKL